MFPSSEGTRRVVAVFIVRIVCRRIDEETRIYIFRAGEISLSRGIGISGKHFSSINYKFIIYSPPFSECGL